MPHTTPKPSRIPGPLHKAGLFVLFAAITAALCLLLNFLLVDDLHAYSRVTLGEYYAQADAVDTVFVGSSHSYRSFDPGYLLTPFWAATALTLAPASSSRMAPIGLFGKLPPTAR